MNTDWCFILMPIKFDIIEEKIKKETLKDKIWPLQLKVQVIKHQNSVDFSPYNTVTWRCSSSKRRIKYIGKVFKHNEMWMKNAHYSPRQKPWRGHHTALNIHINSEWLSIFHFYSRSSAEYLSVNKFPQFLFKPSGTWEFTNEKYPERDPKEWWTACGIEGRTVREIFCICCEYSVTYLLCNFWIANEPQPAKHHPHNSFGIPIFPMSRNNSFARIIKLFSWIFLKLLVLGNFGKSAFYMGSHNFFT